MSPSSENELIKPTDIENRARWIDRIATATGSFTDASDALARDLRDELADDSGGISGHLRFCGAIPETFGHDSSAEKLYSKYTDTLLALAFERLGMACHVLRERADAADVEAVSRGFSFVADAKAFRLSRTAKNQKDFKVQAMHGWKRGKKHAVLVCPAYQLPTRSSQIYHQAIALDVCVLTWSHLAALTRFAGNSSPTRALKLLRAILESLTALQPSNDSAGYWKTVNGELFKAGTSMARLWREEKQALLESISLAREESLTGLAAERERILLLPREAAIAELLEKSKLEQREKSVRKVSDNGILNVE